MTPLWSRSSDEVASRLLRSSSWAQMSFVTKSGLVGVPPVRMVWLWKMCSMMVLLLVVGWN